VVDGSGDRSTFNLPSQAQMSQQSDPLRSREQLTKPKKRQVKFEGEDNTGMDADELMVRGDSSHDQDKFAFNGQQPSRATNKSSFVGSEAEIGS
jgi:hypothetical protein